MEHEALPPDLREGLQDGRASPPSMLQMPTGENHSEQQEKPQSRSLGMDEVEGPNREAEMPQSRSLEVDEVEDQTLLAPSGEDPRSNLGEVLAVASRREDLHAGEDLEENCRTCWSDEQRVERTACCSRGS